jgi:hypothetical protein
MRYLLIAIGMLALGLGVLGAFLPVLPTTPFVLVAAACFVRSSERLHGWLTGHPLFGCYIRDYQAGLGVPARVKAVALGTVWISIPTSITVMRMRLGASPVWLAVSIALLACAVFATWFLLARLPTRSPDACSAPAKPSIAEE